MENFKYYLERSKPTYKFKIKIATDAITEQDLDKLERCLEKFEVVKASKFNKTPIQESPLDFVNVKNMPVHISDIELSYPTTCNQLQNAISEALKINVSHIAVYNDGDIRKDLIDIFTKEPVTKLGKDDYEGETESGESHEDSRLRVLSDLETEITSGNSQSAEKDSVLPDSYNVKPEEENTVSLFGRLKKKAR